MPDRRAPSDPSNATPIEKSAAERVLRRGVAFVVLFAVAVYFSVAAVAVLLRYLVVPHIDDFRPRIEAAASKALHAPVHIAALSARWHALSPVLTVNGLTIQAADGKPALTIQHAQAIVSWRSLLHFQPVLSSLQIDGGELQATRAANGKISVAGVALGQGQGNPYAFSNWLLAQQAIVVRHVVLHWTDLQREAPQLTIRDVRLALLNQGREHKLGLQAQFEDAALGAIDLRADFRHGLFDGLFTGHPGERGNPKTWTGTAYLASGSVDLPSVGHYIDLPIAANNGQMHIRSWWHFANGRIGSVDGHLAGQDLSLRIQPSLPALVIPHVAMRFSVGLHDGDYRASLRQLTMELANQSSLPDGTPVDRLLNVARFDGEYRAAQVGHGEKISLSGDLLDIGLLADFSRNWPLPLRLKRNIDRYDPHGVLSDYQLEWQRQAPTTASAASAARIQGDVPLQSYRLRAQLDGVSLAAQAPPPGLTAAGHPHLGQPGFDNLRGTINATQDGGQLTLDSRDAALTFPGLFDDPTLSFATLGGTANWTIDKDENGPHIDATLTSLQFANPDASGQLQARFRASLQDPQAGRLDLSAQMDRASVPAVPRYLPTSIGAGLRTYLTHALIAGEAADVHIDAHGRLPDLPFQHGQAPADAPHEPSTFTVSAPFTQGTMNFSPYPAVHLSNGDDEVWPALDKINGRFFVDGRKLGVDVDSAAYRRVMFGDLTMRIDDLGDITQPMIIAGKGTGPLADMVDYVNKSPLSFWSNHQSAGLRTEGRAMLTLRLDVPRHHADSASSKNVVAHDEHTATATPPSAASDKASHTSRIAVTGQLAFQRNRLALDNLPAVDAVRGRVDFTDRSLTLNGLQGQWLGGSVKADGNLREDGSLDLSIGGRVVPANAMAAGGSLDGPAAALLPHLSGTAPYSVKVRRANHTSPPEVALRSDLTGLDIDLPAPLGKAAGMPMPLTLNWRTLTNNFSDSAAVRAGRAATDTSAANSAIQRIDLTAGPVRAAYLRRGGDKPLVLAGAIGINRPPFLPQHGVALTAALDKFNADAWTAALAATPASASSASTSSLMSTTANTAAAETATGAAASAKTMALAPQRAATSATASNASRLRLNDWAPDRFDINVGELIWQSRHWNDVALTGHRDPKQNWEAQIDSRQVQGTVEWQPQEGSTIRARLSRLDIPAADPAVAAALPSTPDRRPLRHYPAVDLVADRFTVGNRRFGKLSLLAHNLDAKSAPVWRIDHLSLASPAAALTASGNWSTSAASRDAALPDFNTAMHIDLAIHDGGALLDDLGLPKTLKGGKGSLTGDIAWQGNPGSIDTHSLSGKLALDLQKGQFLKVNPGAARLLGLLSLQGLSRFLQLDFKGLFGKGLAFDHLTAQADIEHGIATAQHVSLQTTPAFVSMTGTADIPNEQQHFLVTVTPHLNVISASLAATAVNPLLGLGTLAAQLALSHPISQSLMRQYEISGSWAEPHVQRIDGNRGNMPSSPTHTH